MLETNDPRRPQINLTFNFDVRAQLEIKPAPYVNLFGVQGDTLEQVIVIRRTDGEKLEVPEITVSDPRVEYGKEIVTDATADRTPGPAAAKAGDVRLRFKVKPSAPGVPASSGAGTVRVKTNHPAKPEVTLPLSISVQPVLRPVPPVLNVHRLPGVESAVGRVSLAHGANRAFRATGVELKGDLAGCTAKVLNEGPAAVQVIEVTSSGPPPAAGVHTGTAVVATDQALMPTIEVPVTLRVPAQGPPAGTAGASGAGAARTAAPAVTKRPQAGEGTNPADR